MSKIINGVASEYEIPTSRCKTLEDLVNNYEKHIKYHDYEFDELSYKLLILDIKKILQENQQLKDKINTYENPEDMTLMYMWCDEKAKDKIKELNEKVDYLKNKCENKDKWCQLLADIGYDYDGYRQADSLMRLIDELVKYAIWSRDNYDYDAFQEEGNNE